MKSICPVPARRGSSPLSFGSASLCHVILALILAVTAPAQDFQITSLTANNALAVEVNALTGDDRGGIAVSGSQVFLTGDAATARVGRTNLTGGAGLGVVRDGLVANLHTETVYLLANGTTPILSGGGTVNALLELDGATGATNGNVIALSASIPLTGASASVGIFSGWDRIVLHNGTTVYHISLPSGTVTTLGTMGIPTRTQSESWAYWGVAENVGTNISIVYVHSGMAIARTLVPAGTTTTLATFANLNDMASITVSVPLGRWYFHHEGASQFGARDETLGFADATFISPPAVPFITQQPSDVTVLPTEPASFSVAASGSLPLAYQWKKNGVNIPGATAATLSFAAVADTDAGVYSVGITNIFGGLVSSNATLTVQTMSQETFKVRTLTTNNLITANPALQAGDDRGGIAASASRVFLRGDEYTGNFSVTNLSDPQRVQVVSGVLTNYPGYESLVSDLRSGRVYLLANGTTPLGIAGGTVTTLLELDGNTGLTNGSSITLGTPIALPGSGLYSSTVGILAGWGRIGLHTGSRLYSVRISDGAVTDHGAMSQPARIASESWAYWGLLENWGGNFYVVHTRDAQSIVRTRVPDGVVATVATFSNLNDMANFTVGVTNGRWFFHNESVSQFSANPNFGEELIGMADAAFIYQPPAPIIVTHPQSQTVTIGASATFNVSAIGTPPLTYQWQKDGTNLLNATNTTLVVANAQPGDAGLYAAVVSNLSGNATSSNATLTVVTNFAPTLNVLSPINALEDPGLQTVSLSGIGRGASHESGQVLTVTAFTDRPDIVNQFNLSYAGLTTGTLSFTPVTNANGTAVISVVVTDDGGTAFGGVNAVTNSFILTLTNVNDAPIVAFPTNNLVVLETQLFGSPVVSNAFAIVNAGATNEAGQALTLTVTNDNNALFSTQPALDLAGNLSFTLNPYLFGTAIMTVVAQDNGGTNNGGADTTVATLTITVLPVNNQPTVNVNGTFPTVLVLEDCGPQRVTNWLNRYFLSPNFDFTNSLPAFPGAPNETNQTFTFVIVTNFNPSLFAEGPAIDANGILTFTPARDAFGSAQILFYVMDSGGTNNGGTNNSMTNGFSIFVNPVNDPPTMLLTDGSAPGVVDGSFEGSFTFSTNTTPFGWTVTNLGSVNPFPPIFKAFRFNTSFLFYLGNSQLFHGLNALAHNFYTDLPGGETNRLYQEINVTAGAPVLSFTYEAAWDMRFGTNVATLPRVFRVMVQPVGGGTPLLNVPVITALPGTASSSVNPFGGGFPFLQQGVKLGIVDLSAFAGQRVRVCFDWEVPEAGTGLASFLMDDVRMLPASRSITALTMNEDEPRTVYLSGVSFGPFNELSLATSHSVLVTNVITATSSDTNVIREVALLGYTNILSGTAQLRLMPAPGASGTAVITVVATDLGGTTDGGVEAFTNTFTVTVNPVNDAPVALTNQVDVYRSTPGGLVAFGSFTNSSTPLNNGSFETGDFSGWIGSTTDSNVRVLLAGENIFPSPLTNTPTEGGRGLAAFIPQGFYLAQDVTISSNQPVLRFDYRLAWNRQDSTPLRSDGTNVPGTFDVIIETADGFGTILASNLVVSMPEGTRNEDTGPRLGSVDLSAFVGQTVRVSFRVFNGFNFGFGPPIGISFLLDNARLASGLPAVTLHEDGGPYVLAFPGTHTGSPEESGQVLTASVSSTNAALLPVPVASLADTNFPAGTLSLTLGNVADAHGSAFVTVTLRDNGGTANGGVDGATNAFLLTFLPVNDAPSVAFTTNNVVVLEDSSAFTGTIVASTNVGPANESSQTVTNIAVVNISDPALFSVQPVIGLGGGLTFTPAANAFGTATVTVAVQDNGGTDTGGQNTSTNTFTITVTPVNDAPSFTLTTTTVTVQEDSGLSTSNSFVTFSAGPNETNQVLGYTLTNANPAAFSAQPAISTNGTLTFAPATNFSGSVVVTVFAQDDGGTANGGVDTAAPQNFTITVTPVNDAPTFTKGADQIAFNGDGAQTVTNWATAISPGPADEAGQLLNFTIANNNNGIFAVQPALSTNGTLTWTPLLGTSGVATVTLQLTDDGGTANSGTNGSATQTFTIAVASTKVFVGTVLDVVPDGAVQAPINLAGLGAENSASFTLDFNPAHLAISSVSLGSGAAGATLITNTTQLASGKLGVVVLKPAGMTFPAGTNELLLLGVQALGSSPPTNSPLTFSSSPVRQEVTDTNADVLSFVAYVAGFVPVVTPGAAVEGDVSPRPSGNGSVSVSDAVQVGRFVSGLDTAASGTEFQRADSAPRATSGNGQITLADLVQTLRFAASLDTPGAPGGPTTQTAAVRTTAALPAGARVVRVVSGSLVAGRANTVSLQLDAQGNEAGLSLSLNFDASALAFVSATTGSGASGGSLMVNSVKAAAGKVGLVLVMPAGSTIAAGTRDIVTLTFNVTGSGSTAISVTGDSPVAREVADVNANILGATYVNGSFNLILPVGLKATGLERAADGSLRLVIRNSDGTPITAAQAAKYQVHVTSNLGGAWTVLPNALVVENGELKIVDPSASAAGLRLYKLAESP
jgi:hypothetical protein